MSLEILKEKLKTKDLSGLYYLCGDEEYLKDHYYQLMRKKAVTDMVEFNVSELKGENLSLNMFENLINSFPMMSESKFISVIDLNSALLKEEYKKQLSQILLTIPQYACIVFLDTAVKEGKDTALKKIIEKSGGLIVEINQPGQAQLAAWGKRHFKSLGKNISNEDMYYILRIGENDMFSLKNEIMKIAAFSKGNTVTRAEIDAVITKSLETNCFALSAALSCRDFPKVIKIIEDLYAQNYDEIRIANLIYRCYVELLRCNWAVAAGKRNVDLKNDFGMNEYGASKCMRTAKNLPEKQLMRAVDLCFECEIRLKSESGDKREMLYQLICKLLLGGKTL